jgi:hypothetical protein
LSLFLKNVGTSETLRKGITDALHSTETESSQKNEITLVLDTLRTLKVLNVTPENDEWTVQCEDIDDQSTIILHLPNELSAAAQADIISYNEEGA